jgi:hypothetical protein
MGRFLRLTRLAVVVVVLGLAVGSSRAGAVINATPDTPRNAGPMFVNHVLAPSASVGWSWRTWGVSVKDKPGYEVVRFTGYCSRATTWHLMVTARPDYGDRTYRWGPFTQWQSAGSHAMHARLSSVWSMYYTFRVKIWPTGGRPEVYTRHIFVY